MMNKKILSAEISYILGLRNGVKSYEWLFQRTNILDNYDFAKLFDKFWFDDSEINLEYYYD